MHSPVLYNRWMWMSNVTYDNEWIWVFHLVDRYKWVIQQCLIIYGQKVPRSKWETDPYRCVSKEWLFLWLPNYFCFPKILLPILILLLIAFFFKKSKRILNSLFNFALIQIRITYHRLKLTYCYIHDQRVVA